MDNIITDWRRSEKNCNIGFSCYILYIFMMSGSKDSFAETASSQTF